MSFSEELGHQQESDQDRKLRKAVADAFKPLRDYVNRQAVRQGYVSWASACQGWTKSLERVIECGELRTARNVNLKTLTQWEWWYEN